MWILIEALKRSEEDWRATCIPSSSMYDYGRDYVWARIYSEMHDMILEKYGTRTKTGRLRAGTVTHPKALKVLIHLRGRAGNLDHDFVWHAPLRLVSPAVDGPPRRFVAPGWPSVRAAVLRERGGACESCGEVRYVHVHHIVPRSRGGTDHPSNLKVLCAIHHMEAHSQMRRS